MRNDPMNKFNPSLAYFMLMLGLSFAALAHV